MWFEAFRKKLKACLYAPLEHFWRLCLRVLSPLLLRNKTLARWSPAANGRVLVLSPHPDDETIGCGGVIQLHKSHGDRVTLVEITDGTASRANGLTTEQMRRERTIELQQAVQRLAVDHNIFLQLPEGRWSREQLAHHLKGILRQVRPDIIYTPCNLDYHAEHRKVAEVLAQLLPQLQINTCVRIYEIHVPLSPILVNTIADVSAVAIPRNRLLDLFTTQQQALLPVRRHQTYTRLLYHSATDIEVFLELSTTEFSRFVTHCRRRLSGQTLRYTQARPFSDLLPYVCGRRFRRQLLNVVREKPDLPVSLPVEVK